jgi:hypothetical protein
MMTNMRSLLILLFGLTLAACGGGGSSGSSSGAATNSSTGCASTQAQTLGSATFGSGCFK